MSLPRYAEYRDSGIKWLGKMPAHWQVRRTKFLFDLMRRSVTDEDGIVTAFRDGQVTLRSNRRIDGFTNALQEVGYQGVRSGDLVIHAMDAFAGAIGVSDSDGKSTPVYSVCQPKAGVANSHYYANLLRYMALGGFINSLAKGIRERSTDFRWADASTLFLPLPSFEEQETIVTFLGRETAKIDAMIAEQEKLLALLAEKRQATISHAVARGLDPNVPMKDSGIPWLGEVPAHWQVKRVKHVVAKGGYKAGPFGSSLITSELRDEGDILVLNPEHVARSTLRLPTNQFLPSDRAEEMSQFFVDERDVVFPIVGSLGRAMVITERRPGILNQRLAKITPDERVITSQYLKLLITDVDLYKRLDEVESKGAIINHITKEVLLNRPLALPPVSEQKKLLDWLADRLGEFDEMSSATEHAIDLMKERRSALIAAAVTGQIDVRAATPAHTHQQQDHEPCPSFA